MILRRHVGLSVSSADPFDTNPLRAHEYVAQVEKHHWISEAPGDLHPIAPVSYCLVRKTLGKADYAKVILGLAFHVHAGWGFVRGLRYCFVMSTNCAN
jgi:hypothetical protein